tara:strand:- start:1758 stop:2597 length:840 start_codon:yes stop_codon:yes gene_type:complete
MAPYGKLKSNTLTYDIGSGDTDVNISLIPPSTNPLFNGEVRFADSDASHYTAFKSPATVTTNVVWTLPATDSTGTQFLKSDGSGNLGWATDVSLTLIDEDNMATDSATAVPSQQSVKAYVDAQTLSLIDEDDMATDSATAVPSQQSVKAYVDSNAASLSGAAFTGAVTNTSTFSDSKGDVRAIPYHSSNSTITLTAAMAGTVVNAQVSCTVPANVFSTGDTVTIVNEGAGNCTISQGSGFTLYNSIDGTSGNRTLGPKGICTIWWRTSGYGFITGAGLS